MYRARGQTPKATPPLQTTKATPLACRQPGASWIDDSNASVMHCRLAGLQRSQRSRAVTLSPCHHLVTLRARQKAAVLPLEGRGGGLHSGRMQENAFCRASLPRDHRRRILLLHSGSLPWPGIFSSLAEPDGEKGRVRGGCATTQQRIIGMIHTLVLVPAGMKRARMCRTSS